MKKRMTTVFREMMAADGIIVAASVFDPLSARIAVKSGFKVVSLGGFAMGAHLCIPEPLTHLGDLERETANITAVIDVPLKVDVGAGFGEPLHVMRTQRVIEAAGAACHHIEDQIYPKRAHYFAGIEHTVPLEDMLQRIKAAVAARQDPDFVIVGRTDAMITDGFDEGVRRANMYLEAGADAALIWPNTVEEAIQAPKEIQGPVFVGNLEAAILGRPAFSAQELEDMGYKYVSYPLSVVYAATKAMKEMFETLAATGRSGMDVEEGKKIRKYLEDDVMGLPEMYEIERATVEKALIP